MSLVWRKDVAWIRVKLKGIPRVQESLETNDPTVARKRHAERLAELKRESTASVEKAKVRPDGVRMWQDASDAWRTDPDRRKKRTFAGDITMLDVIDKYWRDMPLEEIDFGAIKKFKADKAAGIIGGRKKDGAPVPCSAATVNRWLALVRAVLRACAAEYGLLKSAPAVKLASGAKSRTIRFLTRDEAKKVLSHLSECYQDLVKFSLATGVRQANCCRLEWSQVNLDAEQIIFDEEAVKNGDMLAIPLNGDAMKVLRKYEGKHAARVFVNARGQTLSRPQQREWKAALAKAGIGSFRWHDLRHTWASWMRQDGVPDAVVQELGGWKDASMLRKYAHFDQRSLRKYVHHSALSE